jgi:hypothetical protein
MISILCSLRRSLKPVEANTPAAMIERIIKSIEKQLEILKELNGEMDKKDWSSETGILLTGYEAISLLEILKQQKR